MGRMMRGRWLRLLAALAVALASAPVTAVEQTADEPVLIHWLVPDYPPGYISRGPRAGQGQGDRVLAWFRQALPGYRHRVRRESLARTMGILASGRGDVCVPGFPAFASIRDDLVVGDPIGVVPPLRVITLRDRLPRLPVEGDRVSLAAALADPSLTLAVVTGRDYLDLDTLIRAHSDRPNVLQVSPGDMVGSLFGMLFSGRVDYLVDHGFMLPYVRSLEPERGDELVMLPVEEAKQAVTLYPMCRDSETGRQIIRQLNAVVSDPAFRRMMVDTFRDILPERERVEYQRLMEETLAGPP